MTIPNNNAGLPQFSHIDTKQFPQTLDALLKRHLDDIKQLLTQNPCYTWDNLIEPLENQDDELERVWSPLTHLHSVMDSKALRVCYEDCLPLLSAYEAAISHNKSLYEAIKSIDQHDLNDVQKKIIQDKLLDFELSGVALSKSGQKRFEAIEKRLAELSTQFEHHILDATQAFTIHLRDATGLQGLPDHALNAAKELAESKGLEGYMLNLEYPCFQAVMMHAEDRALRETMYQAYITRASDQGPQSCEFDNTPLMNEILKLKHEEANLLGFKQYSELSLATKMAQSPEQVLAFLNDLADRSLKQAQQDIEELKQFARQNDPEFVIKPWDLSYLSEQRRQALFDLSQEKLRQYFPEPKVLQGIMAIIKKLYGIQLEELKGVNVWHPEVKCYALSDEHGAVRGFIYLDLYARANKRGGAWMDSLQSRRKRADGSLQLPIATLTCNFAKPSANQPARLSHDEVITLFHEFGHCLHHLLTQVDYFDASGINGVEWDAVELPSQFFENWCWHYEALLLLSQHVDTAKPLPEELFAKLQASKNFQSAVSLLRQMEFALFDFRIHNEYQPDKEGQIAEILGAVRTKTSLIPCEPYNRFEHSFSHIFAGGYDAGYYSYSWAEVLSSDAFSRFEEEGIFNENTGRDFLHCILEVGGSIAADQAYKAFRGREATIDALLRHRGIS